MKRLPFDWFGCAHHRSAQGRPLFRFYFDERLGSVTLTMETGSLQ